MRDCARTVKDTEIAIPGQGDEPLPAGEEQNLPVFRTVEVRLFCRQDRVPAIAELGDELPDNVVVGEKTRHSGYGAKNALLRSILASTSAL